MFYSWDLVTAVLQQHGLVEQQGGPYYVSDLAGLIKLVEERVAWVDIGLPQLYGSVKILATDPTQSNSGNSFAGLLANLFNQGDVVTATDMRCASPRCCRVWAPSLRVWVFSNTPQGSCGTSLSRRG